MSIQTLDNTSGNIQVKRTLRSFGGFKIMSKPHACKDLVNRLSGGLKSTSGNIDLTFVDKLAQQSSEIERLRLEVERLRRERDERPQKRARVHV